MKSCPYCNAVIPDSTAPGRITCPRCGESIAGPSESGTSAPLDPEVHSRTGGRTGRQFGWKTVALLSLPFLAGVVAYFIPSDEKMPLPRDESVPRQFAHTPDRMKVLGYLPTGIDLLIGTRNLAEIPLLSQSFAAIQQPLVDSVGVDPKEIDELVLGLRLNPLGVFAAIRTREPTPLAERLRNQKYKMAREDGRAFYEIVSGKSLLNPVLAQPDPHILTAALSVGDAAEFSERPRELKTILESDLLALIGKLPIDTHAWFVVPSGRLGQLQASLNSIPTLKSYATMVDTFDDLDNLVAWYSADVPDAIQFILNLKTGDRGTRLRSLLAKMLPPEIERMMERNVGFELHERDLLRWKEAILKK
jgi:hypothetical protein